MVKVVYTCKSKKYGLIGMGNNPMVGASIALAVAVEEALNK